MILYADTSAMLKLYVDEQGSSEIRASVSSAAATCTSLVAYAEVHAALTQATRTGRLPSSEYRYQVQRFEDDWAALQVIAVDQPLVERGAELAREFGLRGYDSVHLAAAERAYDGAGRAPTFALAAFDNALRAAADRIAVPLLPPLESS